jgi:glucose/arabinose dehydrogenase
MNRINLARILIAASVSLAPLAVAAPTGQLSAPPGFVVELYAEGVENARAMAWGEQGTLFVGSREKGQVYAVSDRDGDGRAETVRVIAKGLRMPVGLAFRDGSLYVSAVERIVRLDDIENRLDNPPEPVVAIADLPSERHHGWRYIAFGPDGKLYVPIGAPCNICDEDGFATILRMNADGSERETIAEGVRNTVGFDWQPTSGTLWFTDNGRDWLGDDLPECELNRLDRPGQHFGFPHCHAGVIDPEFGEGQSCSNFVAPAALLGAHTAPLGMRFYTGEQYPAAYRGDAFIARHGSWNRSTKSGYDVVRVRFDGEDVVAVEPFLTGFLDGQKTLGRPVDVIQAADGSLLISDDYAHAIYRVRYTGENE